MSLVAQLLLVASRPWDMKEQVLWSASRFLSVERAVENAASLTFLLTGLSLRLLRYLGIGAGWITKLTWLMLYAAILMPGFLQALWYYFFSPNVKRNIRYGSSPRNMLDLYLPPKRTEKEELFPVVIFVTGGAWIIGYKGWGALLGQSMEENGVIVACLDYRNFPQGSVSHMVSDVSTGINWVLSNIQRFGGDPQRVYLVGQSAGAHLAATSVMLNAIHEARSQDKKARLLEVVRARLNQQKSDTAAASMTLSEPPREPDQLTSLKRHQSTCSKRLSTNITEIEEVHLDTAVLSESKSMPPRSILSRLEELLPLLAEKKSAPELQPPAIDAPRSKGSKTQQRSTGGGVGAPGEQNFSGGRGQNRDCFTPELSQEAGSRMAQSPGSHLLIANIATGEIPYSARRSPPSFVNMDSLPMLPSKSSDVLWSCSCEQQQGMSPELSALLLSDYNASRSRIPLPSNGVFANSVRRRIVFSLPSHSCRDSYQVATPSKPAEPPSQCSPKPLWRWNLFGAISSAWTCALLTADKGVSPGSSPQPAGIAMDEEPHIARGTMTSSPSENIEASCSTVSSSSQLSPTCSWTPPSSSEVTMRLLLAEPAAGLPHRRSGPQQGTVVIETSATIDLKKLDALGSSVPRWSANSLRAFVGVSGIYNLISAGSHLEERGLSKDLFSAMMEGETSLGLFSPELLALLPECRTCVERGLLPPMWLFHGTKDISVPDSISSAFATSLKRSGADAHCKLYPEKSHTDLIIQDPMRGGQDELVQDLLNLIDTGFLPGLKQDVSFCIRQAKYRARMVPESFLYLAGIVSPF